MRRGQRCGRGWIVACILIVALPCFWPQLYTPLGNHMPTLFSEWEAPKPRYPWLLESVEKARLKEGTPLDIWSPLDSRTWVSCIHHGQTVPQKVMGYLQVFLEGGLNQQRMAICDAVALARLLKVILVLPQFDVNPFWQDSSSFADIFDVDHFIQTLEGDVQIVKELPAQFWWSTREYYATGIRPTRVKNTPAHAPASWFVANVLPVIRSYGLAAVVPFSHRLAFDGIPPQIQKLRCKVNFQALLFVSKIRLVGDAIISRLRSPAVNGRGDIFLRESRQKIGLDVDGDTRRDAGKFIVLHLRFDKDMAAHSSCDFGGGKIELLSLAKYRQDLWQGRVSNSHYPDVELRKQGKCPLTPEEIGLMLAALGFGPQTRLYVASYRVYGGRPRMAALRRLFPLMENKYSLTTEEEITALRGRASLLAALDYYVSLESDIFVSASPGNMHNALVGHRAYKGVKKTIRPDLILLSQLFSNKSIEWEDFRNRVVKGHQNRIGFIKLRQVGQSLYTYPATDCLCQRTLNFSHQ
eukprot:c27044_g1_i1 orf=418-1989(+)